MNRSPCTAIDHNVPEEVWLGRRPGYQHMKRFGSLAFVYQDQGKLKPRALKGVFLDYPQGTKGYKIWLLDTEKCVISRNVVFQEQKVFKQVSGQVQKSQEAELDEQSVIQHSLPEIVHNKSEEEDSAEKGGASTFGTTHEEDVSVSEVEDTAAEDVVDFANYQLAKDCKRREPVPPAWLADYSNIVCALIAA